VDRFDLHKPIAIMDIMDAATRFMRALQEEGQSEFGLVASLATGGPDAAAPGSLQDASDSNPAPGVMIIAGIPVPAVMVIGGGIVFGTFLPGCCFVIFCFACGRRKRKKDNVEYPLSQQKSVSVEMGGGYSDGTDKMGGGYSDGTDKMGGEYSDGTDSARMGMTAPNSGYPNAYPPATGSTVS
jgi:hypothetical protein